MRIELMPIGTTLTQIRTEHLMFKRLLSILGFNIYWQFQDHFIPKFCELKQLK